jgi:glycosyltransferase involved in cell wall biosynthesis
MVREPVAGLSRARNKGIEATSGAFIANIDDDATACPEWLESVLSRFAALPEDVAAIGGEIDPVWQAEPPAWLDERMKGLLSAASNMGPLPRYIEPPYGLFEGNSCYRRSALLSVGCYPVALGRAGGSLLSGEGAVTALMRHKGWRLFFDPAMLIHHTIHADRLTPNWLRKRLFWQGISDYAMHRYHQSHGINTVETIHMELPLKPEDWNFLNDPSAQNLSADLVHLECLGFVLAMSGLISVSDD